MTERREDSIDDEDTDEEERGHDDATQTRINNSGYAASVMNSEESDDFKKLLLGEFDDDGVTVTDLSRQVEDLDDRVSVHDSHTKSVIVDITKIGGWIPTVITNIINYPSQTFNEMTDILNQVLREKYGDQFEDLGIYKIRPAVTKPLFNVSGFDDINSQKVGKMITLRGVVTGMTIKKPYPVVIAFKCQRCGTPYKHRIDEIGVYYPPSEPCSNMECQASQGKTRWKMDPYSTRYVDFRKITIQEEPEFMKSRQQPRTATVVVTDDIVDVVKPGSRVILNGKLIATPEFKEDKQQWDYGLFNTHVFCFNIEAENSEESENAKITEKREQEITDFVNENSMNIDEYFKFLTSAVAPMIDGFDEVKLSLLCSVVGGQLYCPEKNMKVNPYVHVLLVGDPGTAKTTMIESIRTLCQRFEYASGQGSSGRGLTAAVVTEDGEPYLQAGAAVLADGGICAIDEFEKIKKEDRSAVHEQMEHGRVTIRKWKFQETLMARTTIIAAANPKKGHIVRIHEKGGISIQENLSEIPIPIQSRFALIFLLEDKPERERDKLMIRAMRRARSMKYAMPMYDQDHEQEPSQSNSDVQEKANFVRDLCVLAKRRADDLAKNKQGIGITDEAEILMEEYFLKTRSTCIDEDGELKKDMPIPITAREYGSIDKISTAIAKLTFSRNVEKRHVEKAISLKRLSMEQTMMDEDGNIDAGMAATGKSKAKFDKDDSFLRGLKSMEDDEKKDDPKSQGVNLLKFTDRMMDHFKMNEGDFEHIKARLLGGSEPLIKMLAGGKRICLTSYGERYISS